MIDLRKVTITYAREVISEDCDVFADDFSDYALQFRFFAVSALPNQDEDRIYWFSLLPRWQERKHPQGRA